MHAHHIFPVAFEQQFEQIGIQIWDAANAAWWEATSHLKNAYQYNSVWGEWLAQHTDATLEQTMEYARTLAVQFGINWP